MVEENDFLVAKKVKLDKIQTEVECIIQTGANVKSVLATKVEGAVEGYETLNGVLNFSGLVDVKLVFVDEDEQIGCVASSCPFSAKFENDLISTGQSAVIELKVIDSNIASVNGDVVKVNVMLEGCAYLLFNEKLKSIRCDDEDICAKEEEMNLIEYLSSACEKIDVTNDIGVREKVKKLLICDAKALIRNVESGVNFVSVSGDVIYRVLYIDENDKFQTATANDTFKEEIELEGVNRDSLVEANVYVDPQKVECEIVEEEKGGKIVVKAVISLCTRACNQTSVSVIKDLYSTKSEINVTTESFSMSEICPMKVVEGKIEGNLTLDEDRPRVDKILFNTADSVTVTNSYIKDGEIFLEGIARTTVVYLNDEDGALHSAQIEVPFTISDKTDFEDGGIISVEAIVTDSDVAVKKGRDLFYDAKVKATVSYCKATSAGIITEAVLGEEMPERDYAMEVIFGRSGQQSWDIAKESKVKEEQLIAQNPEAVFPLQEDESLILFYQKIQ